MDYKKCAADILHYIGGEKNIVNLEHCSTRLRFTVANQENVNQEGLKKVQGVMKLIVNSQVQVVIGNSVIEVYDEIMKLITIDESISTKGKKKVTELLLEYLIGIFQPLIPVMAGAGILKSILVLLSTLEILSAQDNIYKVLLSISDATFYFMPIMVAYTTAAKLKTNKMVAIAAVGVLLLPNMTTMLVEGIDLLGIGLKNVAYSSQVFPAILCTLFLGMMEKALNKVTPKVIRTFFVPMIATLDEFRKAKGILMEEKEKLISEGIEVSDTLQVGIMIEIPAAAVLADQFAKEVDFFSIGTNDLVQYTFAADRMSSGVSYLYQPFHPSILRLVKHVIDSAHAEGKWTGMCGEMAGEAIAAPLLIGLGLDEFSMSATSILSQRKLIRSMKKSEMNELAAKAINCGTMEEVVALVKEAVEI